MRAARVGNLLLTIGLVVGVVAGIGLLVGFEPARLPRELLNIAAYKLTFLAAGGLLAAGATFLRYARREEIRDAEERLTAKARPALAESEGAIRPFGTERQPERVETNRASEKGDR